MEKKDEVVTTSMSCLVILMAPYTLAEGPLIIFLLQYLEIWSFLTLQYKHARADCAEAHSNHQKRWFAILRIQCVLFYSAFSVDRPTRIHCALNARFFCIV